MHVFPTLFLRLTAIKELGFTQTSLFSLYQLGKHTGIWHFLTPQRDWDSYKGELKTAKIIPSPGRDTLLAAIQQPASTILASAEEIVNGRITIFGELPAPLKLTVPGPLRHWTNHESGQTHANPPIEGAEQLEHTASGRLSNDLRNDIKFTWEPARFGWVYSLARAYIMSEDERYPAAFWRYFKEFCDANPPNTGPNWASGQEVGLRLIALSFAHRVFEQSAAFSSERLAFLGRAVAAHASRIPPTLLYARAQNNNHLLSEAAALYTAGLTLPGHPNSKRWRALGWKWFHHGLQTQIEPDGTYSQHSANYHRLMLQLALWVNTLAKSESQPFPVLSVDCLAAATHWLLDLCDPETGRVPNLGANDGAYIFPFTSLPYYDYRPVLQAASIVFLGKPVLEPGKWDEMALWFRIQFPTTSIEDPASSTLSPSSNSEHCILTTDTSRAYLRAAHFNHRPGHADQLHLDLWWRGINIALDPGTYLYNARPPWDNALTTAFVHNTLTVNDYDQMTRAGRFLYVNRAQAKILERTSHRIVAEHNGYRKLGLIHRRTIEPTPNGWLVTDNLFPNSKSPITNHQFTFRLHWLLPDWDWKFDGDTLQIHSPHGWIAITITNYQLLISNYSLYREGKTLFGPAPSHPTWGWFSPTYGVKQPALALTAEGKGELPFTLTSEWRLTRKGQWV